jgi:IS30 family transposase
VSLRVPFIASGQIKNAVSISERPAAIEDRALPGHWEDDLIGGSRNSYVATPVEVIPAT